MNTIISSSHSTTSIFIYLGYFIVRHFFVIYILQQLLQKRNTTKNKECAKINVVTRFLNRFLQIAFQLEMKKKMRLNIFQVVQPGFNAFPNGFPLL